MALVLPGVKTMDKAKALRLALQTAKTDYGHDISARHTLARVIAYLTVKVRECARSKTVYRQLPMFAVIGAPKGKYRCVACGRSFGENTVSPLQSKRAYLTLHCPHCYACWFEDRSQ